MTPIGKDITKYYQMACSSMSYTPFTFYGLMFSMCLFCLFLRHFSYIELTLIYTICKECRNGFVCALFSKSVI